MTQYTMRGNLSAARFPLVSTFSGRTIIIPQYDQNFQKLAAFSGGDQDRDIGIPQVYYAHNTVPTSEGFQSVGYAQAVLAMDPPQDDFNKAFVIRDSIENKGIFVPAAGKNYVFQAVNNAWQSINPLAPGAVADNDLVTVANLRGHTYQFYENFGCFEYDFNLNTISAVPLSGLVVTNIKGICASVAYLICWDATNTIFWSSTITATDFTPSLSTGAGSEIPNDLKGSIVVILPAPNGFIIYTTRNAVFAAYTGNIRFPWVFREIPGSAGIQEPNHASWEANTGFQIAWTTSGLMKVERTGVEVLFPEVTDFFTSRLYEDYSSVTGLLTQSYMGNDYYINVVLINSRFLILSYGLTPGNYTHAIFVDLTLKRFGKLKFPHVDCFDWPSPNLFGIITYDMLSPRTYDDLTGTTYDQLSQQQITVSKPKRSIAFLQRDGSIYILDFDLGDFNDDAVLFLGKFQMVRNRKITFQRLETENVDATNNNFAVKMHFSDDGKNFARSISPVLISRSPNLNVHGARQTGENFTIQYSGAFNLTSFLVMVTNHGDR